MREIPLTNGGVALVDDEDYPMLALRRWRRAGGRRGYAMSGRRYMHREIMQAPPEKTVDHINANSLDNRRANLRVCTRAQNERWKRTTRSGGYRNVFRDNRPLTKPWRARVSNIHLGYYATAEEAARAADEYTSREFGEYARLNLAGAYGEAR